MGSESTVLISQKNLQRFILADTTIGVVRVALTLGMLGYTSYSDIKTREVSDLVWIIFGGAGLVICVYEALIGVLDIWIISISLGFMLAFAALTGFLGLFGGADLLAFITLALLTPYTPVNPPYGFKPIVFPLSLVTNAVVTSCILMVWVLFLNLVTGISWNGLNSEPLWKKLAVLISGRRVNVSKIRGPPYDYPLEILGPDGVRRLSISLGVMEDEPAWKIIQDLKTSGVEMVWMTKTIPFLVSLLVGFIITLFAGDLMLYAVDLIIRH